MPVRKGKLNKEDELRIQKNYTYLEGEIDGQFLVAYLFEKNVFTKDDMDEVNSHPTRAKRATALINLMLDAGPDNAFAVFIESLRKNYQHVVDRLMDPALWDDPELSEDLL